MIPFTIRVEKARNEMRHTVNQICAKYELPGEVIALLLESALAVENQQRFSLMCEQITLKEAPTDEAEVNNNGNSKQER